MDCIVHGVAKSQTRLSDFLFHFQSSLVGFPGVTSGKEPTCQRRRCEFDPWVGKFPWRMKGYPLQYSDLENSMDCVVHGVAKNRTQLNDFHFHFTFNNVKFWGIITQELL